jgi:hypothetical protein
MYAVEIPNEKVYHHSSDKTFHNADAFVIQRYFGKVKDNAGSFSVPSMVMHVYV